MEQRDQMALVFERVSVRHRVCCWTLFNGRLTRLTLFKVWVSHGSALELRTTLTVPRGAKAAAEAGSNEMGMVNGRCVGLSRRWYVCVDRKRYYGFGTELSDYLQRKEQTKGVKESVEMGRARLG